MAIYYKVVTREGEYYDGKLLSYKYYSWWMSMSGLKTEYKICEVVKAPKKSLKLGYGLFVFDSLSSGKELAFPNRILICESNDRPIPMRSGTGNFTTVKQLYDGDTSGIILDDNYFQFEYPGTVMLPSLRVLGVMLGRDEREALEYMNS